MNLDEKIGELLRVAEQAEGTPGYGVSPNFILGAKTLIKEVLEYVKPEAKNSPKGATWEEHLGYSGYAVAVLDMQIKIKELGL